MAISNDSELKTVLQGLSTIQQRQVAALFTESVLPLSSDPRVAGAVISAKRPDISDPELAAMYQAAKTAGVESYTQCGRECDWAVQAGHFVSKAATACVQPAEAGANLAWEAAMQARMARMSETIATGEGTENREAETQYRILEAFLNK
jgi:hypothetical protein